jgi:ectoine hydroxylase-related dioxygenase (phytanoyl-CoA dioxygenase family)
MGNLHVFPKSHLHEGLRKYYKDKINDDDQDEDDDGKPDLGESVQVLLEPGDVVIAHQLLGHRVGVNTSENIRYQLYYRVQHNRHEAFKEQIIDDPWVEFAV